MESMDGGSLGIVGASGFIGGALGRLASSSGWRVIGFSRHPGLAEGSVAEWREWGASPDLSGLGAIVNLAGEAIDKRWTDERKRRFRESRVGTTRTLVDALARTDDGPRVLLNGSAVGFYGNRGDERLTEDSEPGHGFLADLCRDWEAAAFAATQKRVITWRTGVVLGAGGAAWKKMRLAFSLGLGGRLGGGHQWMPWVHIDDLVGGMLHALERGLSGPVNGTAPSPVRNSEMTTELVKVLRRPAFMHVPGWALRLGLGEFATAILASQRVVPTALEASGYTFRFPTLRAALEDLVDDD